MYVCMYVCVCVCMYGLTPTELWGPPFVYTPALWGPWTFWGPFWGAHN